MNPIIRNILALLTGAIIGGLVNGGLIAISSFVIAPPAGSDLTTPEGLKAAMSIMEPKHFIMPFLAHALGVFVGAFLTAMIATTHKIKFAITIGVLFLLGGITMIFILPTAPFWFKVTDLVLAYIPMAYLGGRLAMRNQKV